MSYDATDVFTAETAIDKYRGGADGEIGAALAVVGLSAEACSQGGCSSR